MRAFFKQLLKGSGTPVIQTVGPQGETILSAANIWTSAHARRIALRERGVAPGDVVCGAPGPFEAAVDFVACCIGGFTYVPLAHGRLPALGEELAARPVPGRSGFAIVEDDEIAHHPAELPESLAALHDAPHAQLALFLPGLAHFTGKQLERVLERLSGEFATSAGGARLTRREALQDAGFVSDFLLGLSCRQTIHWRGQQRPDEAETLAEIFARGIDDLVLPPRLLAPFDQVASRLAEETRSALLRVRLHTGGEALSPAQREIAERLFGTVLVEPPLVNRAPGS